MKTIRLFCIIFLALANAVLLYQPMAAKPIVEPNPLKCPMMSNSEVQQIERIDIPSHRGDYAILDRHGNCSLD